MVAEALTGLVERAETTFLPAGDSAGPRALIPIRIGDNVEGVLAVYVRRDSALPAYARAALEALATQLGVALTTQRLRERVVRQDHQLSTIYEITRSARFLQPLEPTLAEVHRRIADVFATSASHIALYDPARAEVSFPSVISTGQVNSYPTLSVDDPESLTCWVIRNDEPFATADWAQANKPVPGLLQGAVPRSILCFPMRAQGEVLGAIGIQSERAHAYSEVDYYLLNALAGQIAVIVRNARLHDRVQTQVSELATLYEGSALITSDLKLPDVLYNIVRALARSLDVRSCALVRWDSNLRALRIDAVAWRSADGEELLAPLDRELALRIITQPSLQACHRDARAAHFERLGPNGDELGALLDALEVDSLRVEPLVWRQEPLGLLLLGDMASGAASGANELRVLSSLSSQVTVALEHARLYQQAEKRLEELSLFQKIGLQITSRLDINVVLDTIGEVALQLLDVNNLHIYLYDADKEEFEFGTALWRDGQRVPAVAQPRKEGLTATVARRGEPVVINDADRHALYRSDDSKEWGVAAIAGFPLKRENRVIGVFTVTFLQSHAFGEDELLLLKLLADQASVAVQNAQLFRDLEYQLRMMSALVEMAQKVTGRLNEAAVMENTVERVRMMLGARACTIALVYDDTLIIEAAAGIKAEFLKSRLRIGEGASGLAVAQGKVIYVPDTYAETDFPLFDPSVRCLLAVPLTIRDEVFGTLTVDALAPNAFDPADIQFLTIAASQVSVAIVNARLFEQTERRAEQLANALEELKQNYQLMDELVQNLSHELRTPLNIIKLSVDLLRDGAYGLLAHNQKEALEVVSQRCDVIDRLLKDIVTPQRITTETLETGPLRLNQVLTSAVQAHQVQAAESGHQIICEEAADTYWVTADRERMHQVLDNLIGNAVKFSPHGGRNNHTGRRRRAAGPRAHSRRGHRDTRGYAGTHL